MRGRIFLGLIAGMLACGCGGFLQTAFAQETNRNDEVKVEMKNVFYHFSDTVSVHILQLQGMLVPTGQGQMPVFDDKGSFVLSISVGQISISTDSLAHVLNENVFNRPDSPIAGVSVRAVGDKLLVKGKLRQKGDIPFETTGVLSATGDGRIRLHAERVKAAHLPVTGLMDLLGLTLSNLVNTKKVEGVTTDGNDLLLDPGVILPPPHIQGKVLAVRIAGDEIIQTFGKSDADHKFQPGNYMAYRGNQLRFGKLTMADTDLTLIDMDPRTPFDFYLDHYKDQLAAGYTKITLDFGLRVFMRDYNQLPRNPVKKIQ